MADSMNHIALDLYRLAEPVSGLSLMRNPSLSPRRARGRAHRIARDYPIAIGEIAKLRGARKKWFAEQCFARVWPKQVHGFGVGTREMLLAVPFHSVDATSWEIGPGGYGRWRAFDAAHLGVRGSTEDLRAELAYDANVEQLARHRWRHTTGS